VFVIVIFVLQTEAVVRHAVLGLLDVLFGASVVTELAVNPKDWQVLTSCEVVYLLEALKELITHLTDESVVVLVFDVHNELPVILGGRLGHTSNALDLNDTLEF
jgi:hypothetical protein